ncbi:TPA: hypothetical protein ACHINJ_002807 [Enterobacter roggenkampii]
MTINIIPPEEAVKRLKEKGITTDTEELITLYGIDQAARIRKGDRLWIVNDSSTNLGSAYGHTLSHAVHIFVLSYEENRGSLFE